MTTKNDEDLQVIINNTVEILEQLVTRIEAIEDRLEQISYL